MTWDEDTTATSIERNPWTKTFDIEKSRVEEEPGTRKTRKEL